MFLHHLEHSWSLCFASSALTPLSVSVLLACASNVIFLEKARRLWFLLFCFVLMRSWWWRRKVARHTHTRLSRPRKQSLFFNSVLSRHLLEAGRRLSYFVSREWASTRILRSKSLPTSSPTNQYNPLRCSHELGTKKRERKEGRRAIRSLTGVLLMGKYLISQSHRYHQIAK